jgi:hypothetical protein
VYEDVCPVTLGNLRAAQFSKDGSRVGLATTSMGMWISPVAGLHQATPCPVLVRAVCCVLLCSVLCVATSLPLPPSCQRVRIWMSVRALCDVDCCRDVGEVRPCICIGLSC